ncbi:hypothetical protein [Amycolatopsis sp. PS_44_ISF1]|uniref:hypothetical protein n=1 Tax=Amycolatopsis sp. PS_44_ISF1 TaxID=2974917 RepID=UPI0028E08127|nr:hypothetical protein [Amycolatopsis sp. PS_44_ISF1]MDT8910933.1 hypothetical protein [Amycolatopsis sp. PS_44_ISF1]
MRPRFTVLAALATGIGIGLAGCGQQPAAVSPARQGGQADTSSRADPAAGWAGGYCGAVTHLVRTLSTLPAVDPSSPARASSTSSRMLGSVVGGIDQTVAGLDRLGSPPVGADQAREELVHDLVSVRRRADDVRRRIDSARNPAAISVALGEARGTLDEVGRLDLLKALQATPELSAAGKRAPECQPLVVPPAPR